MKKLKHPHRKSLIQQNRRLFRKKKKTMTLKRCRQYSYCFKCPASRRSFIVCYYDQ